MFRVKRWIPSALAFAGLLAVSGIAYAALVSEVKDDGGFFSADAIKKANREIKDIKDQTKHDLVMETYKEIAADKKASFEKVANDRDKRGHFFEEWARERARALEVNGVYIVVFRNPSHLEIQIGTETRKKAFTLNNRRKLRDLLVDKFKEKKYDEGLLEALAYVHDTMKANLKDVPAPQNKAKSAPTAQRAPAPAPREEPQIAQVGGGGGGLNWGGIGGILCILLVVGLVVWVVIGLIRSLTGSRRGGPGSGPGYGPG